MKKIISILVVLAVGVAIMVPSQPAQAQVISNRCCDSNNVIRCIIDPPGELGGTCYCNYQGWGHVC